jgi:hypothetical protein
MTRVGFIGLGIMGTPMAGHLVAGGHEVYLHSRSGVPNALTEAGGVACRSGREVAERADVIIDFRQYAGKTIYLENRLDQPNGQGGPTGSVVGGGQGFLLLKIIVDGPSVADNSVDPPTLRSFDFDQTRDGQWTVNGSCSIATLSASRSNRTTSSNGASTADSDGHIPFTSTSRSSRSRGRAGAVRKRQRRPQQLLALIEPVLLERLQQQQQRDPRRPRHAAAVRHRRQRRHELEAVITANLPARPADHQSRRRVLLLADHQAAGRHAAEAA